MMSVSSDRSPGDNSLIILDTWPVMEWLKGRQPTAQRLRSLFEAAENGHVSLLVHSISIGEVFYSIWKVFGEVRAQSTLTEIDLLPIQIVPITDESVMAAARIKGAHTIAYDNAFVASLAQNENVPVLTGDPDFLKLEQAGLLRVIWMGA